MGNKSAISYAKEPSMAHDEAHTEPDTYKALLATLPVAPLWRNQNVGLGDIL